MLNIEYNYNYLQKEGIQINSLRLTKIKKVT